MSELSVSELSPEQIIRQRMADVEAKLGGADQDLRIALVKLDGDLKRRPDLLHILTDDDVGKIFKGQMQITRTVIVSESIAKRSTATKSGKTMSALKATTLDDL